MATTVGVRTAAAHEPDDAHVVIARGVAVIELELAEPGALGEGGDQFRAHRSGGAQRGQPGKVRQLANLGWKHPVIPDAIFAIRVPARQRFAVEYDRLTEGLEVLASKLDSYSAGIPGFSFEAVVIVTERDRRLDLLTREMRKRQVTVRVLATTIAEVEATTIFDCRFRELPHGERSKLLEIPDTEDAGEDVEE